MCQKKVLFYVATVFILYVNVNGDCALFECSSDLNQSACSTRGEFLEINTTVSCCPRCRIGLLWGSSECDESRTCAPGLQCLNGSCTLDKTICSYTYHLHHLQQLPQCENDGKFSAKQCKGDRVTGRCFCYSDNGKRIFGWDWHRNSERMTCACSRHRHKLESWGKTSTLHCTPNGNYESLQCDSGVCWCADEKTGQIINATRAVPQTMWKLLPCCGERMKSSLKKRFFVDILS